MVEDFIAFLGSFKNTESISSQLREAIQVSTSLEPCVSTALHDGRLVLLTGSAGSGKTHLLRNVLSSLREGIAIAELNQSPRTPHVYNVPDATELEPEERNRIACAQVQQRIATIMAINEGPLRESAALDANSPLALGVSLLHEAQRGLVRSYDSTMPTVVDMGAFDPLASEVLASMLSLPLLSDVISRSNCSCSVDDCPRRTAWRQMSSPVVRDRVANVIRLAGLQETGWLFRDIWDFVADLTLEGSCNDDPPTSPWFWRLFYGDSRLSRALVEIADPVFFAIPIVDSRLYFGDWRSAHLRLLEDVELLPVSQPYADERRFKYVKAQAALLHPTVPLSVRVLRIQEGTLAGAVYSGLIGRVISAINEYMTYRLRPGAAARLDLVLEHSVKRAVRHTGQPGGKVHGILKIGEASSEEFEIRSSQVLMNHPDGLQIPGNRQFLFHLPSKSSFELSKDRLRLLHEGRSMRLADRDHVDLAWDLTRFFEFIFRTRARTQEFASLILDFERMRASPHMYRSDSANRLIEAAE